MDKFTIKNFEKLADFFEEREYGGWICAETETQYTLIGRESSLVIHRNTQKLYDPYTFNLNEKIFVDVVLNGNTHRSSWDKKAFVSPESVWGIWKVGLEGVVK